MIDSKIGEVTYNDDRARGGGHSPVIRTGKVKNKNGNYPLGLVVSRDENGDLVPYVEAQGVAGVLDEPCDTAACGSVLYIPHGSVIRNVLVADNDGAPADAALLKALEDAGIYPE